MSATACCEMMSDQLGFACAEHPNVEDCPDKLVDRWRSGHHVLLIHDGGTSGLAIAYCPWCGHALAEAS